ncbi:MAG: glyoxalase [SAR86 cluster bacterium]|uniref:Glyoxalase n=1 Tax=SAR86 cluster bacterium TaxID=2030880 RepID=A0A2A5C7D6_9GAMM|nr:VOC family protein [Gammaproteobacteria bacterium AH-315-E17]PCJ39794.1 MAG: glyoxalase [SAR86 cluster bacterium]
MTDSSSSNAFDLQFKPHHFGISVNNLEESIAWYCEVLGFEVAKRFAVETVPFKAAFVTREGFNVEIFEVEGAGSLPAGRRVPNEDLKTQGNKHMAFQVDDIKALFTHFKEIDVDIAWDVFPMGDEFGGFIRDNTGNLIEFVQL